MHVRGLLAGDPITAADAAAHAHMALPAAGASVRGGVRGGQAAGPGAALPAPTLQLALAQLLECVRMQLQVRLVGEKGGQRMVMQLLWLLRRQRSAASRPTNAPRPATCGWAACVAYRCLRVVVCRCACGGSGGQCLIGLIGRLNLQALPASRPAPSAPPPFPPSQDEVLHGVELEAECAALKRSLAKSMQRGSSAARKVGGHRRCRQPPSPAPTAPPAVPFHTWAPGARGHRRGWRWQLEGPYLVAPPGQGSQCSCTPTHNPASVPPAAATAAAAAATAALGPGRRGPGLGGRRR
jgi:hypothetical protein